MHTATIRRLIWPLTIAVVLLLGLWLVNIGLAQEPQRESEPQQVGALSATVDDLFTYQGRLTDDQGNPLSDSYTMRFFLYDESVGGSALYDSGTLSVAVEDGLFAVELDAPQSLFDGQALWLQLDVEGETLSPRQAIRPAPYAMGLRPGASVEQNDAGDALSLRNTATGAAVRGESEDVGLYGKSANFGVYGVNEGGVNGAGYGGYFESSTGIGVFGGSTAVPSTTNSLPAGVYGFSENGAGVYGEAGSSFAWGGYFDGHVRIDGSLVVSDSIFANDKSGYVFDVALNDDTEALNRGDVVVVTGVAPETVVGEIPVFTVRRASSAESTGVVGVVDRRYVLDENDRGQMEDGPAAPGDYLGVVTLGAFQAVKVDASYGAIRPGDLLVSSPTPGHVMRADDPGIGTVIGKALDELDEGTGVIAVMVSLQ